MLRGMLEPSIGYVLVKLANSNFGSVSTVEKKFDSITSGKILAVYPRETDDEAKLSFWIGRMGYWEDYKDSCRVKLPDGSKGAFIKIDDVAGVQHGTDDKK